jgi:Rrf2 family protein
MIKLSKMSDHALLLCSHLTTGGESLSAAQWAALSGVPEPTTTKILKALCVAKICESKRGKDGGYKLAKPGQAISFLSVVEAMDGPIRFSDCSVGARGCIRVDRCGASPHVLRIGHAIRASMSGLTIDQIAHSVTGGDHVQ